MATVTARFTGAAYPFGPTPDGVLGPKTDESVVLSSIINILTTPQGSIPYNPAIGSQIPLMLFEINDEVTRALIRYYAARDLAQQEPRIVVRGVYTDVPDDMTIIITVGFSLVGDPTATLRAAPVYFSREWEA